VSSESTIRACTRTHTTSIDVSATSTLAHDYARTSIDNRRANVGTQTKHLADEHNNQGHGQHNNSKKSLEAPCAWRSPLRRR
jgi:hypothetical protein